MSNRLKLIVKNFEIVKDATLVVEGITSIMGETANGKTAMYNAAKVLAYNLAGKGYIRLQGGKPVKEGCTVTMVFEEDKAIVQFFKKDSPEYKIQKGDLKKKYEKAGRGGPPEDVVQVLNMEDLDIEGSKFNLNFIGQLEPPLLKQMNMQQLYKTVVKSFDGEKIQEAIKACQSDQDEKKKEITKKETEIEIQKKQRLLFIDQVKLYTPLDELKPLWDDYDTAVRNLPQLEEWNAELLGFKVSQGVFVKQLEQLKKIDAVQKLWEEHGVIVDTLADLREISGNKTLYESQHKTYSEQVKKVNKVCTTAFKKEFDAYLTAKTKSLEIQNLNNEMLNAEVELEFCDKALKLFPTKLFDEYTQYKKQHQHLGVLLQYGVLLKNIAEMVTEWNDQLQDVTKELDEKQHICDNKLCPTCKGEMKTENKEAMEELKERIEKLQNKKVEIEAKKQAKKEQVDEINAKIEKAGYDPKKLPEEITKLEKKVDAFEEKALPIVEEVEKAVAAAENEEHQSDPETEIDDSQPGDFE